MADMTGANVESRLRGTAVLSAHRRKASIIVADTSPLILLACAGELDVLSLPGLPVRIPDAVYTEAIRSENSLRIGNWINRNGLVRFVPTDIGVDQRRRLEEHRSIRGMGEAAALETLDILFDLHPDGEAVLLWEDSDVATHRVILDESASLISTGDLLRQLEHEKKISSIEQFLDKAAKQNG